MKHSPFTGGTQRKEAAFIVQENPLQEYTLIVLSGGQGQRMGGADKGLVLIQGKAMIDHLIDSLSPRPTRIVISANRHIDDYARRADLVVSDIRPDFAGPLAGLEAALPHCTGLCVCLPCDLLQFPPSALPALLDNPTPAHITVLEDPERRQPLCLAFYAEHWQLSLQHYLDSGKRSAYGWLETVDCQAAPIDTPMTNHNHASTLNA